MENVDVWKLNKIISILKQTIDSEEIYLVGGGVTSYVTGVQEAAERILKEVVDGSKSS